MLLIVLLLLVLVFFGGGFAFHLLWILAVVALICLLIAFATGSRF